MPPGTVAATPSVLDRLGAVADRAQLGADVTAVDGGVVLAERAGVSSQASVARRSGFRTRLLTPRSKKCGSGLAREGGVSVA